jgi:hypothetical protein
MHTWVTLDGRYFLSHGREYSENTLPDSADKRFPELGRRENPRENNRCRRPKLSPIPLTIPNNYPCSEILASAQLDGPLSDRDRESLRKDCQS